MPETSAIAQPPPDYFTAGIAVLLEIAMTQNAPLGDRIAAAGLIISATKPKD